MQIALFDLDHTLIPFDSGGRFAAFLAERGALRPGFSVRYLAYCEAYAQGAVDIVDMHRFVVGAMGRHPPEALVRWLRDFEATLPPLVPATALELVREHRAAGHLCALVTATTRFIAEPFARVLGLDELLATEPACNAAGHYTGEVVGLPCFREHKLAHVMAWLERRGLGWDKVERSWFYSDSANDLALLQAVTDPVAIDPDPRLAAIAEERGWPSRRLAPVERIDRSPLERTDR